MLILLPRYLVQKSICLQLTLYPKIIHRRDFKTAATLEQSKTILIQMKQKAINGRDIPPSSEDTRGEIIEKIINKYLWRAT